MCSSARSTTLRSRPHGSAPPRRGRRHELGRGPPRRAGRRRGGPRRARRCRAAAPTPAAARPASAPSGRRRSRPAAGRGSRPRRASPRSPTSTSGGGWPATRSSTLRPAGSTVAMHSVVKTLCSWRSCLEDLLQRRQEPVRRRVGEHERAPRDPQADAERGLVGAVAADVGDHRLDRAVGALHGVVEVAAEQGAAAAGLVVGRQADHAVVDQRRGQQAALQAGVLGGDQPRGLELLLDLLGPPALDGVADRAGEQPAVDLALDQVVLGAVGDRLGAPALVVEAGEDDDRGRVLVAAQVVQGLEARRRRGARGRAARSRSRSGPSPPPRSSVSARCSANGAPEIASRSSTSSASASSSSTSRTSIDAAAGSGSARRATSRLRCVNSPTWKTTS